MRIIQFNDSCYLWFGPLDMPVNDALDITKRRVKCHNMRSRYNGHLVSSERERKPSVTDNKTWMRV